VPTGLQQAPAAAGLQAAGYDSAGDDCGARTRAQHREQAWPRQPGIQERLGPDDGAPQRR